MAKIRVTETVLRDGHQSLIATRMRTDDMLPICEKLDKIGFWSLEVWGGATFDSCIRFLKEDPWERLRQLKTALPNTPLQMLLRGQNLLGYRHYSDDVVKEFVKLSAQNGIDIFRIFDAMNDVRNLKSSIKAVKKNDKHAQGAICYTTSPVHNNKLFVKMAKQMQQMGCDSIVIKDMAGLLTPYSTSELVKALVDALDVPLHIHSHATAGLASMCQLKALEAGCSGIDTAISAFAEGTSHPTTESMVAALIGTPYETKLNLVDLQNIGAYFYQVRKKYHQFESEFTGLDTRVQVNQVPGGMISNLSNQLKEQGELNRMNDVLDEIPRVRADLGYPPLVTPTSQIVGTQAVLNVLTGARYKTITNEVKLYLQGKYGKAPGKIDKKIKQHAIGNEDTIECRPADLLKPELSRLKSEIGALAKSDEDVIIFSMFPDIGKEFLEQRSSGTLIPEYLEPIGENEAACPNAPTEFLITLHGEEYHIKVTGTGHQNQERRPFYMTLDGVPEELQVEILSEISLSSQEASPHTGKNSKRPKASQPGHVTTSMPGVIVDVLVKEDDKVEAGTPIIITEAMKMETEIQAPISGIVTDVYVAKGDTVNPDEILITIK
ncbi:MAG: sodium-extruding oxaloacetate decarboxylase subunit alpha [gamma proteobacterium symbiont of Bathyaustriella thionipta]|nr:sodium-extruding oxaloacetate decarboxylase subunit alpha [gamma proteobacterium symbiont of Bathyaustriella thionipta]MCU7951309.1 sodium-extruding oxaloacetate decarboxylase subunit alpha [gamma proteobacterium symbiont of Bathyaustriella thionipta]MCU7953595.1 sodium-extruding oxaloacetate decarboxylase subunit alpha [gamma proteobacterium symbiont of Bathyaustriella thionipta]MCU7957861.1 sodium-extruding oxaloacetate decarboxylase subunit alpha [gamma proteobacterium symbiont of Bathyaus